MLAAKFSYAVSLQVSPVSLNLTKNFPAAVLALKNFNEHLIHVQIRAFDWQQEKNNDQLTSTNNITVSPPLVEIAPGKEQIVRVIRITDKELVKEESYRLLVDELPNPYETANHNTKAVAFRIRYSIPVFANDNNDISQTKLDSSLKKHNQKIILDVVNRSQSHAQLSQVSLAWPNGTTTLLSKGLLGYVLPGKMRSWPLSHAPQVVKRAVLHWHINGVQKKEKIYLSQLKQD